MPFDVPNPDRAQSAAASADDDAALFRPLVKRSITIAGHPTSVTLEPLFWDALIRESVERNLPVNALVARIDADRLAVAVPPNLASAIRLWLFAAQAGRQP